MRRVRKSESSLTRLFVYAKKISRGIHATDWLQLSDWGVAAKCIFHLKLGSREEPLPRRLVSIFDNMTKKDAFIKKNVYKWCVVAKADNDDDATDVRIETLAYSISGCLLSPPLLVSKEIAATDIWASNKRTIEDRPVKNLIFFIKTPCTVIRVATQLCEISMTSTQWVYRIPWAYIKHKCYQIRKVSRQLI